MTSAWMCRRSNGGDIHGVCLELLGFFDTLQLGSLRLHGGREFRFCTTDQLPDVCPLFGRKRLNTRVKTSQDGRVS